MREWTREERYVALDMNDLERLKTLHAQIQKSIWRCDYHVQTVTGLMGDTNGFSYLTAAGICSINGSRMVPYTA